MQSYNCRACAFTFSEADRSWDSAVDSGRCPKCSELLSDFPVPIRGQHHNIAKVSEEDMYAAALAEVQSGATRPGMWAKAFAESEGDENKSKALYIKLRVQNEMERIQQEQKAADVLAAELACRKAAELKAVVTNKFPEWSSGVNGWLLLLVLKMTVFGPLFGAGGLYSEFSSVELQHPTFASLDAWKTFKLATWGTFVLMAGLSFYGGFGLSRGKDWSVVNRAKAILWITGPGSMVIGVLILIMTTGKAAAVVVVVGPQFIATLIASVIVAGIWTVYLSKSKRVRATYGRS